MYPVAINLSYTWQKMHNMLYGYVRNLFLELGLVNAVDYADLIAHCKFPNGKHIAC